MVDGDIDIETSDVTLVRVRQQKLWNPATDDDHVIVILT